MAFLPLSFPSFSVFFSALLLFIFTSSASNSQLSSSTVASKQLKFWSSNVHNEIPQAILSKLSPLTEQDSGALSDLFSKQQISPSSSSMLCSLANLACAANLDIIKPLSNSYRNSYTNIPSSHIVVKDDPFSFFRLSTLKNGNKIHLPDLHDIYPSRAFLPVQIGSKISIDSIGITRAFPQSSQSSITKEAIQMTISLCNAPNMKGEIKKCPRSLEEMIEFSKYALGRNNLVALTSKSTDGSGNELIIGSIKQYDSKNVVSCHELFLPFSTYYCHMDMVSSIRLYEVEMFDPQTNVKVNTLLAICHMDTSTWPKEHVAFKLLKITPGKGEACHWFSKMDLAWISA